ncbi:MAG: SDR family NAD(P)-dependent oxidoreductase, partial [Mariprofundaceae bacterium]|nr:SDR family NAD(P)-dependent oxidoreductase [Mariprofundaceae bacterium]
MTMRVLVTGAAGFIGMHVTERLLSNGYAVTGVDNLNDYYEVPLKEARLERLAGNHGFDFYRLDIADAEALTDVFAKVRPGWVIHLAAQAGVRYSLEHPEAYVRSNLVGFAHVLEACRRHGVQHLLYASSSSVYGANKKSPFSESDPVDHPVSFYAATKKSNELMAHSYAHLYGFPCTGLRFFTVYGPWGRPDMAYFSFTRDILAGKPLHIFNHGNMKRDFTYIDDIVDGVLRVLDAPPAANSDGARHAVMNIGNDHPVRLGDFVDTLESLLGVHAIREMYGMQPGDVVSTHADITAL